MQGGRSASAVEAANEAAANVGASAWAGKEKTKAVVEGAVEKARALDPAAKDAAEARKVERIREVEATKRDAMRSNAAAKERATAATDHPSAASAAAAPPPQAQPVGVGRALDDHPASNSSTVAGVVGHVGAPDRPAATAATAGADSGGAVEGQAGSVPVSTTEGAGVTVAEPTAVTHGGPPAAAGDGYPPARA